MPVLKVVGPIPATAWIPLAMVVSPVRHFFRWGADRARGLVSGHDADRFRHFQHARFVSRCCPHPRRRARLPYFSRRHSRGDAEHFHRAFHGTRRLVPDAGRCRNRRGEVGPRLVCQLGAGMGRIRKSLRGSYHHGGVLLDHHDVLFKVRDRVLVWQKGVIKW